MQPLDQPIFFPLLLNSIQRDLRTFSASSVKAANLAKVRAPAGIESLSSV